MAKYNTRLIKKVSQLNSDIQYYRCKDFSLKQVSGLMGDPDPPGPPPGSATALVPFDILSTAFGSSWLLEHTRLLAIDARSDLERQSL